MQGKAALVSVTLIAAGAGAFAFAADRPAKIAPPPTYNTNMEMLVKAGAPGEQHQFLNYFVGEWDVAVTTYRPGSPPNDLTAIASIGWELDGRFLKQELSGEFQGDRFNVLGYLGYDNFKGRYTAVTMDSASTSITSSEGYQNLDGNELILFGNIDEPHLNLHDRTVKYVHRSVNKDQWVTEVHDLHIPEPNSMVISMVYTRR